MLESKYKKFAFLVHSRDYRDIRKHFPILYIFPDFILYYLIKFSPPIIASKITGLKSRDGTSLEGYVIAIPMTARQMIEDRVHTLNQIRKAVTLAQKRGVGIIGFGALTSSFSRGGLDLTEEINTIGITTGRAYTVKTVTDYAKKCVNLFSFDKKEVKVGIVGAGGSIGSGSAKILATWGIKKFVFIDLEKRAEKLKNQILEIEKYDKEVAISISHQISSIKDCDIIIAATNSPEVLIKSEDLKPGAIVINDAQPSDVSPDIINGRPDVLIIEGGVIKTSGIKCNINFGLADNEDTFCCLGEVLILAYNEHYKHFALGELNTELIQQIEHMGKDLNFTLARFQNSKGYITEFQINNVRSISINSRRK